MARGRVECLVLDRRAFEELLGDLQDIMDREIRRREAMQTETKPGEAGAAHRRMSQGIQPEIQFEDLEHVCTVGTGTFGVVVAWASATRESRAGLRARPESPGGGVAIRCTSGERALHGR